MTGCPTKNFVHEDYKKNKEHLWETILFADQQNFPMCTAVASQMEDDVDAADMKSVGLVDGHAYSLIAAKEIKTLDGTTVRLCLIRNPWGKKEWQGDWSDESPLWDAHCQAQVPNFKVANDGCFWLSFEDYDTFFYITTICFFKKGFKESQVVDEHKKGEFGLAKLTLSEDAVQPLCLTVDQVNCRFGENGPNEQEYAAVRLFVTKIVDGSQQFLDGEYEEAMPTVTCAFKKGLKKGEYLVMYSVDFLPNHPLRRIILTNYCEDTTTMVRLDPKHFGYERFMTFEEQLWERKAHREDSIELV